VRCDFDIATCLIELAKADHLAALAMIISDMNLFLNLAQFKVTSKSNMSAQELRQRKAQPATGPTTQQVEEDTSKDKRDAPPDLEPDIRVVLALVTALITIIVTYYLYRVDLRDKGPFSTFVNDRILGFNPYPGPQWGPGSEDDAVPSPI